MNLLPSHIAAFHAVLRSGSLSGAARLLGLSQPTVRAQIADLEGRLATPLFTRTRSGLAPTDDALILRERAEAFEAATEAFARAASGAASAVEGRVRLTASRVMATHVVPGVLAPLARRLSRLTIELAATDAVEDLTRHDADVALRLTEPRQAALVIRKLKHIPLGFFAAPDLIARMGIPDTAKGMLAEMPFVFEDRLRRMADGFAEAQLPLPARIALATDEDLAQIAAVEAGIGVGIMQARIGAAKGLVPLLPGVTFALPLWVVMHEDLRRSARVRAVFDHLVGALS